MQPNVEEIPIDSPLGWVMIGMFLFMFIITFITFYWRWMDRKKTSDNLCHLHDTKIKQLDLDMTDIKTNLQKGFDSLDGKIDKVHTRVDDFLLVITNNNINRKANHG
jgi:hypothetical protein